MQHSPLLQQLIDAFRKLPGVGAKSAQRMMLYFLERDREGGRQLASAIIAAMDGVGHCTYCRALSETELCHICAHPQREQQCICVVETPADVMAIEQTSSYRGVYFVLMGHLSPIDGIGPDQLAISELIARAAKLEVGEVILATNPTVEGEATAWYIAERLRELKGIKVSRIAHGVPVGGELEYVDSNTLVHSLTGRQMITFKDDVN
jgi:recombination protein RecR